MGKSKEISQDLRKKFVDIHKSGSSLGAISKCLKVPCLSVQTTVHKFKHHGTTQPSYRSGDERTLVWKVQINPRSTVKRLEEMGAKVSISTVNRVLYQHNLKGCSARKEPLLQNCHTSQITVYNCIWRQISYFLEKCPLVWGKK